LKAKQTIYQHYYIIFIDLITFSQHKGLLTFILQPLRADLVKKCKFSLIQNKKIKKFSSKRPPYYNLQQIKAHVFQIETKTNETHNKLQ